MTHRMTSRCHDDQPLIDRSVGAVRWLTFYVTWYSADQWQRQSVTRRASESGLNSNQLSRMVRDWRTKCLLMDRPIEVDHIISKSGDSARKTRIPRGTVVTTIETYTNRSSVIGSPDSPSTVHFAAGITIYVLKLIIYKYITKYIDRSRRV